MSLQSFVELITVSDINAYTVFVHLMSMNVLLPNWEKYGNKASITFEIRHRLPDKQGNHYPSREQCYITTTKTANSNQEWTNLILKKVILPGMGMKEDGTSTEKIGLLWDEFRGHSAEIVKEFCTSLPFFYPEIIPGGLTPLHNLLTK